jgi:hypothetical protein
MKELLQTPDEIIEVFKALIFAEDDDMQPLIDGSTSKMVSFANASRIILHTLYLHYKLNIYYGTSSELCAVRLIFHNCIAQTD